ncbi:hypothetical protein GCM10027194_37040 [Thalassiella azotivora]
MLLAAVHVVWQAVTAVLPGGGFSACLPAVARLAAAGAHWLWAALPSSCSQAVAADARQVALAAVLTVVPLLATHVAVLSAGAASWSLLRRSVRGALAAAASVVVRPAGVPAAAVPQRPVLVPAVVADLRGAVVRRVRPRRGPPVLAAA